MPADPSPINHTYSSPTTFLANYASSEPSCAIVYACATTADPKDLCSIPSGGLLVTHTGEFTLSITDKVAYPPGIYSVAIEGEISSYPDSKISHIFEVEIGEVCSFETVGVPAQTNPPDHTYSGPTSFEASYTVSDSECAIEFACVPPESGVNLCAIGDLDSSTGFFQITTTDFDAYPPGTYSVEISGSIAGFPS